jgi:hypothetical protein
MIDLDIAEETGMKMKMRMKNFLKTNLKIKI